MWIKIAIIIFWVILITPLVIMSIERIKNYYPIITVDDIKEFFVKPEEIVIQDFENLSQKDITVYVHADNQSVVEVSVTQSQSNKGEKELYLSFLNKKEDFNLTTEINVKSFNFATNFLNVYLTSENFEGFMRLTLVEEDGDSWIYNHNITLKANQDIKVQTNISTCKLKEVEWWNHGFKNISKIILSFYPNQTNYKQRVIIDKISISKIHFDKFLIIPMLSLTKDNYRNKYPVEKENGTFRIVALGDSMLYGVGIGGDVNKEDLVTTRLENKLNNLSKNMKFEVLNFGVPGHNTELEVDFYQETAYKYFPDLILIFFVRNDIEDMKKMEEIMNQLKEKPKYKYLFKAIDKSIVVHLLRGEASYTYYNEYGPYTEEDMDLVERSLQHLKNIVNNTIPIAIIALQDTQPYQLKSLGKISKEYNWPLLELDWLTKKYGPKKIYIGPNLVPVDNHPSPFAHNIIAEELFDFLISNKLIQANI